MSVARILVLYGTTDGQTGKVASAIAATLQGAHTDVDLVYAGWRTPRAAPEAYDAVIVAASVHAGGYQRGVIRWVERHARALERKPNAFVSVCLGVLEHNPKTDAALQKIVEGFVARTTWRPAQLKIVAGALRYTRYNWFKRRVMRNIVSKVSQDIDTTRDYEYTDWNDLHAFAETFLANLGKASAA